MNSRIAKETILNVHETFKVLLVTGPRQTGKTTLLKSIMPSNMSYVTLDDKVLKKQAQEDPELFLQIHKPPILIDEAQYAPELFPYIKIIVDESDDCGQFWLTGSQRFSLMENVSESLAGRVGIVELNSFTYNEVVQNENYMKFNPTNFIASSKIDVKDLFEYIYKGGMPQINTKKNLNFNIYFRSYIDTYLERDVKEIIEVSNDLQFENFLRVVASRNGEQLNYTNISRDVGVSVNTIIKWFSILVKTGIVYLLKPYSSNHLSRLTRMPKIVFMDSGLCAYLEGFTSFEELLFSDRAGHYLETYVISEIVKTYNALGLEANIFYYRDKDKNEIDLIFDQNNTLYPFEIKKTANPATSMIKNFLKLKGGTKKVGVGGIICLYDTLMPLDRDNYIIPVSSVINISKEK